MKYLLLLLFLVPAIGYTSFDPQQDIPELFAPPSGSRPVKKPEGSSRDFLLITIPKSGTHLATKLLAMLTGRKPNGLEILWHQEAVEISPKRLEYVLNNAKHKNEFGFHHTGKFYKRKYDSRVFMPFFAQHTDYVKILQIRDLRDVFVSLVDYFDKTDINRWSDFNIAVDSSYSVKLTAAIKYALFSDIATAPMWLKGQNTIILRFEDIVGPSGGGTLEAQQNAIINLANMLQISLTQEELKDITDNVFGPQDEPKHLRSTFHKGQIGRWKKHFKDEHVRLFNELWGDCQQALGYPLAW